MSVQTPKEVNAKLREKIKHLAKEFFKDKKGDSDINITTFNLEVLIPNNINYKDYVSPGKAMLKRFMMMFPETFVLEEKEINGGHNWFCKFADDSLTPVLQAIEEIINKNGGRILLASLAPELSAKYNIDYREYSNGKKLSLWLKDKFSDSLVFDGDFCQSKRPLSTTLNETEKENPAESNGLKAEVEQMHAIAFMSWWVNNAKTLNNYIGQKKSGDEWSAIVARALSLSLSGINHLFTYDTENDTKIVFNTGIKTANNNSLYCVLRKNPLNTTGNLQPFALEDFCCVAEEENELSNEIKQNVPNLLRLDNAMDDKYEELRNDLEILYQLQKKVCSILPDVSNSLTSGGLFDTESFVTIKNYHDRWVHAKGIIEYLGWDIDSNTAISLDFLESRLEYTNRKNDALKKAIDTFVAYATDLSEYCSSDDLKPIIDKDIEFAKKASLDQVSELKCILQYYIQLVDITKHDHITAELVNEIDAVNVHFDSKITLDTFFKLRSHNEALESTDKNAPAEALSLLSSLDEIVAVEETTEKETVDADYLFDTIFNNTSAQTFAQLLSTATQMCDSKLEEYIVEGNYNGFRTLMGNEEFTSIYQLSSEELSEKINELESEETTLTFYECGNRLYNLIGNHNRTAEKYFLMGMLIDPTRCSQKLISLYFAEDDSENFYKIWQKYGDTIVLSVEETKFLLYVLCTKGKDTIKQFLEKNIYIYYTLNYASDLLNVLSEFNYEDLLALCKKRVEYISNASDINDFEKQILEINDNNDAQKAIEYIVSSSSLLEETLGYTSEELTFISQTLESNDVEEEQYTPISRLYKLQKNKNSTVEALIWESLKNGYNKNCLILLDILNDDKRYDELCSVFNCYEISLCNFKKARELYITALTKTCNDNFYSFICNNIQDCMDMLLKGTLTFDALNEVASAFSLTGDERVGSLCAKIQELCGNLENSLIQNIVILADDLREDATNAEKLLELELSDTQIENLASVYKTNAFPRGRDILSVANRVYAFVGNNKNIAKLFADLALECGYDAVALLWKIYTDNNDIDSKLRLLTEYPDYQKGREVEYCSLLIQKKDYENFLVESEKLNNRTQEIVVQTIMAKCHLNKDITEEIAELQNGITEISVNYIIAMLETMAEFGLQKSIEDFISFHFDTFLSRFSIDEIESIITINGKTTEENLKSLQKKANAQEQKKLAIYLHENFGIGRLKGASKEYFDESLNTTDISVDEKSALLKQLRIIYAKNKEQSVKIILHEMTAIIDSCDDEECICKNIEAAIDGVTLSADGISAFMNLLKTKNISVTPKISKFIIDMCCISDMKKECLEFFDPIPNIENKPENAELASLICNLLIDVISETELSPDWLDKAIKLCRNLVNTKYYFNAVYCAYLVQKQSGNMWYAKFNLLLLLEKNHIIPTEFMDTIENAATENNLTESTNIFSLFVEMVNESTLEEIEKYCSYCGLFIGEKNALVNYYTEQNDNQTLDFSSIETKTTLVKLVYCEPDNTDYWLDLTKIPVEDYPCVSAKLLYKLSLLRNSESAWKNCIDACERNSQADMLIDALIDYATNIPVPYGLQNLRTLLAEKININPLYFSQMEEQKLVKLISVICSRMDKATNNVVYHSAIRDLSIIAISTESDEAYHVMMEYVEKFIFGENSGNLGFAIACRLILIGKLKEAKPILERLTTIASLKYKKLISKLAEMSLEELATWSFDINNTQLLNMILPDGNFPDIHKINEFALSHISEDKAESGAEVICELLENSPNDYGCYMALFTLCKQLPQRIDLLHKALCGLIRNEPLGKSKSYYARSRKDFAVLLSNINAVILSQQINEETSKFDGYDFTVSASEYYQRFEDNLEDIDVLNNIQEAYDNIQNALMNQSAESTQIIYSLVFGYVTGNWCEFLEKCWRANAAPESYLYYCPDEGTGMIRSILRAAYSLVEDERIDFIKWLRRNNNAKPRKEFLTALRLYDNGYYTQIPSDIFEENILDLPFEESSIFETVFQNTVLQIISNSPASIYPCTLLMGYFAYSNNAMSGFWKTAMEQFEAQNNETAEKIFSVMNELSRKEGLYHGYLRNRNQPAEMYESMMRVAGVFAKNETIINKVSKNNFHSWSCINMVLALIYTSRANEVSHLKQFFTEENQYLADIVLAIINKNIPDNEKLNIIQDMTDDVAKGILCYIIKTLDYRSEHKYAFLTEKSSIDTATEMLEEIATYNPSNAFGPPPQFAPRHFMWIEPTKINQKVYEQIEIKVTKDIHEQELELEQQEQQETTILIEAEVHKQSLSIVADLEPVSDDTQNIDDLWKEHQEIHSYGLENYQRRLDITRKIYQIALGNGVEKATLDDYAIKFGIDYYYSCMGNKQYRDANNIIIEMVSMYDSGSNLEGARTLKRVVCNTALHELLRRGYANIRLMIDDFLKNKNAFIKMKNMLPASSMLNELNDVNNIYSALETIAKCLGETTSGYTGAYKSALQKSVKQLGDASTQGWSNVRLSVLQMIRDEINRVDQRPILDVTILNKKATRTYGYIFGQIKNVGNDVAENITLQLNFDNTTLSNPYTLSKLGKGELAAFEIYYSVAEGTEKLNYDVIVSYENKGEKYPYIEQNQSLLIKETPFEEYPTGLYHIDTPIEDFTLAEDGTVYSKHFYGRNEEKRKINSIFNSKNFSTYQNIIIKGIRRAGKTSVLNYLRQYANLKCDDAVAIYVSCYGDKGGKCPIQTVLIDWVIQECKIMNVADKTAEEWDAFAQKWALPAGTSYRSSNDLQYFYRELKALNGDKGLMLILDEFDVLIEEIESKQGVDSTLLPSLRAILNSPYCQDAVHLVICGSTKLARYMDGGTFNQLFQQFGDNIIEIGKLLEKDMEKMLTEPYKEYPSVKFTEQALDWIWKCTSGLVWYSKLVANCALNRAYSQQRSVVYPSDIVDAVTTVTSHEDYFKSLVTSCRPGGELKVLDAIQCSTAKATEYVTIAKLVDLLSDEFSQKEIESITNTLERLQILQRNPFDRYSYRFAVELYWHYFRVTPSNLARCAEIPLIFSEGKFGQNDQFDDEL